MSRRDTILIATLINTSLLLLLFISAMTSNEHLSPNRGSLAYLEDKQLNTNNLEQEESDALAKQEIRKAEPKKSQKDMLKDLARKRATEDQKARLALPAKTNSPKKIATKEEEIVRSDQGEHIIEITVKRGDILDKIARANATTIEEIMELNHLRSTRLQIGQVLLIPLPSKKTIAEVRHQEDKGESNMDSAEYYTIRSGDNPWLIAIKHRMKLDDLLRLNDLDETKARRLKPGDRIRIR